jgi:hypothetical protein
MTYDADKEGRRIIRRDGLKGDEVDDAKPAPDGKPDA